MPEQDSRISLADAMLETVDRPLLALDAGLNVALANDAFLRRFGLRREETAGRHIYELGNGQWDVPDVHRLLEDILPRQESVQDFRVETVFGDTGRRVPLLLNGRRVEHPGLTILAFREGAEPGQSERRYLQLFNSIDQGFCVVEMIFDKGGRPVDYRFLEINEAFERQTGLKDALGKTMRSLQPDHEEHWFETYGRIALTRRPERFENSAEGLGHYYEVYAFPFGAPEERKVGVLFNDIRERRQAEAHRNLLIREINHRAKNILSIVQAIARATARGNPAEFVETFQERIQALAASQDLMVERDWLGVELEDLVRAQMAVFADLLDTRIAIHGPPVVVSTEASQSLGMVLHELATNAGKYGALSTPDGRVDIAWSLPRDDGNNFCLKLGWRESDGPTVAPPARTGFGTRVIRDMAQMNLAAKVRLDYVPSGLVWEIDCPASRCIQAGGIQPPAAGPNSARPEPRAESAQPRRGRILVVEDEAIVAMEMAEALRHVGHEVVGPAGSVRQALALLKEEGCDAAVLDVNLGKESAEPVAEALRSSRTPFLVVSGYTSSQLPEALRDGRLLSKPLRLRALLDELAACLAESRVADH